LASYARYPLGGGKHEPTTSEGISPQEEKRRILEQFHAVSRLVTFFSDASPRTAMRFMQNCNFVNKGSIADTRFAL
jgi:hypothetical protein